MFSKFGRAVAILVGNVVLVAAIVLTVWLPANILIELLTAQVSPEGGQYVVLRLQLLLSGIFAPLQIGALVFALSRIRVRERVTYAEAMGQGVRCWGRLFGARFAAGFYILLGTLALIVPGLVLAARYFLLDYAVVLEGAGVTAARKRSIALTSGKRWEIAGAAMLCFVATLALSVALGIITELLGVGDELVSNIFVDCIMDVALEVLTIVGFLYYVEACEREVAATEFGPPLPVSGLGATVGNDLTPMDRRCGDPTCGQFNPPDARFCLRCGGRL